MKRALLTTIMVTAALIIPTSAIADNGGSNGSSSKTTTTTTLTVTMDGGSVLSATSPVATSTSAIQGFGSPSNSGCGVATVRVYDSFGNNVSANKHWCWSYGSISSQYGWGDYSTCWLFCKWNGWHYNFGFDRGWRDKGEFNDASLLGIVSYTNTDAACVYVYGNGTATSC